MAASVLVGLTGLVTPDVVGKAALMLGEPEDAIRKGVSGLMPTLLSGLASRSENPGFACLLYDLVRSPANDGSLLDDVGRVFSSNGSSPMMILGRTLSGSLFGDGIANFANQLAGYARIKIPTAKTLLNVAAPLVLAYLGKLARHEDLNASSLAALLHGEKHFYSAAVPSQLTNLGNYRSTPDMQRATYKPPAPARRSPVLRWLLPALAAIGGFALLLPLLGSKEQQVERVQSTGTVYFEIDQMAPSADAVASLASVIEYLKANPGTTAVVSSYQDHAGSQTANAGLARHRADAVRSTLVAAGIEESRIETQMQIVAEDGTRPEQALRVEVNTS